MKEKYVATPDKAITPTSMIIDEANIIRYACGFVGMKLHDRFMGTDKAVECIDHMHVVGPASSFLGWTK